MSSWLTVKMEVRFTDRDDIPTDAAFFVEALRSEPIIVDGLKVRIRSVLGEPPIRLTAE